jgi:hypothetical protein
LLWSLDSNASLALIAERLDRSVAAVRKRLWDLGYKAESLGGFKVKEIAEWFSVPPARVQYWAAQKLLLTKGGRITESSFSKFLVDHPEKIPFEILGPDMQRWLMEMGYGGPNGTQMQRTLANGERLPAGRDEVCVGGSQPLGE